jgi:putative aldouronate transport system substrate-binding protein
MMRFVDWLFYSDEGYILTKWGPEGETWEYVEENGMKIKKLLPGFKCGGLGIAGSDDDVDIRLKWGYGGGNYFYAHSNALRGDNLPAIVQDYDARYAAYRDQAPLSPATVLTPEEIESTSLIQADLIANINAWTIQFITGQKDIEADWDEYVKSCDEYEAEELVNTYNEAYKRSK